MNARVLAMGLFLATLPLCGFTCASLGGTLPAQDIVGACYAFDAALPLVAKGIMLKKIPPSDYAAINKAIDYAKPICDVNPMPTSLTAIAFSELQNAVSTLVSAQTKLKGK
jgi:hypothetical protein